VESVESTKGERCQGGATLEEKQTGRVLSAAVERERERRGGGKE
jgi:hypothetical protein